MINYEDGRSRVLRGELGELKHCTARHREARRSSVSAVRRWYRKQLDRMLRRQTKNLVVEGLEEYLQERERESFLFDELTNWFSNDEDDADAWDTFKFGGFDDWDYDPEPFEDMGDPPWNDPDRDYYWDVE